MADKHLSDVIDMDELLNNDTPAIIKAGVGAGKNTWVEEVLSNRGSVFFVTSRKQIKKEMMERTENFAKNEYEWDWGGSKKNLGMTHAMLYKLIHKYGNLNYLFAHNRFDFFVVDEAHSLISDATFTKSAFHLLSCIMTYKSKVKKLILMSGTTDIIANEFVDKAGFLHYDLTEECKNVKPQSISIIPKAKAYQIIKNANDKNRMIYMANKAENIAGSIREDIISKSNINESNIGIVMSDSSAKKHRINKDDIDKISNYLCVESKLPKDIHLLLTEGIS